MSRRGAIIPRKNVTSHTPHYFRSSQSSHSKRNVPPNFVPSSSVVYPSSFSKRVAASSSFSKSTSFYPSNRTFYSSNHTSNRTSYPSNHTSNRTSYPSNHTSNRTSYPSNHTSNHTSYPSNHTSNHTSSSFYPSNRSSYSTQQPHSSPPVPSTVTEKPFIYEQFEIEQNVTPNLNLSTYGYSMNGKKTTRHKALHDAFEHEGYDSVLRRLDYLIDKYPQIEIRNILLDDYDFVKTAEERYKNRRHVREYRESSKKHLLHRLVDKSRSRRRK